MLATKFLLKEAIFVLGTLAISSASLAEIGLPFGPGEKWYICRGYHVPNTLHANSPVLDLSVASDSPGEGGCSGSTASVSAERTVRAPGGGYVSYGSQPDFVCLSLDQGGALYVGHLKERRSVGRVEEGEIIGRLSKPSETPNGGYSHIHIQAHPGATCTKGELVPFEGSMRFRWNIDLPLSRAFDKDKNQHAGVTLANPAASLKHPDGTVIRAALDGKVYYVQGGKRRWITGENVLKALGIKWDDVIVVSSQERDCYEEGIQITMVNLFPFPTWNGYRDGSILKFNGSGSVYVVSRGKLSWLKIDGEDLIPLGYDWRKLPKPELPGSGPTLQSDLGEQLPISYFRTCRAQPPPPSTTVTCTPTLNPTAKNFAGSGGSVSVNVSAASNCSWSVSLPESWIHASPLSGTGSAAITISADKNPSTTASRGNNVTIGGAKFRVDQDNSMPSTPPPSTQESCSVSLNPTANNFSGSGESIDVALNASPSGCSWSASIPESWISATPSSGTGSQTVRISITQNPSFTSSRGNVLTINNASFRVDQDNQTGQPPPPPPTTSNCATALSPTAKNFSGSGGSVSVNVSAPSTCTWGVSLPESWITSSPTSGTGSGSITITVAKNPSTSVSRGNVVTIGGLFFRVDQDNYIP